jgi:hypothetical protein
MKVLAPETDAFDRAVRPVMDVLFPERAQAVLDARPEAGLHARIEELAQKANEGELTENERAEYEGYIRANYFVAKLRRLAEKSLNGSHE